jgi:hypothetical protein
MWKVYDELCNRFTGALGEVQAIKDSGLFKGMVKVRYEIGGVYHVDPDHLVEARYSSEIKRANKMKRSPCLEDRNVFPLDPVDHLDSPVFATGGNE